uniref:Uncharacterized protein n=1 Tax=Amphimedon queenslandica TaxID=400682 RepID=A0A1X7TWW2_AMPQE
MSDSSSDEEPDQHHEILDGGQSTLLQLLKFTRSDQSVSSDLDAQKQDGVMWNWGRSNPLLRPWRTGSEPWKGRAPQPSVVIPKKSHSVVMIRLYPGQADAHCHRAILLRALGRRR